MSNRHTSIAFWRIFAAVSTLILVDGCVSLTLPENSKNYQYEIDLTVHGKPYTFQQYFSCYLQPGLSEEDAKYHPKIFSSGVGTTAADIGDNLVLLFQVGGCFGAERKDMPREAYVLVNSIDPDRVYWINKASEDPPIIINHITVKAVQRVFGELGPTSAQKALKETIRDNQHGFQSVTAQITPYEEWVTSEKSRTYFGQFRAVTVAKVGEAERFDRYPSRDVLFKFWEERSNKSRSIGGATLSKRVQLEYNGSAFEIPGHKPSSTTVWYSTGQTREDHPTLNKAPESAMVTYKGVVIKVADEQEIFDPETQNLIRFRHIYLAYPWGLPDEIDEERIVHNN